ncbi:hypothetical protein BB560_004959 [Smittium megazygosporum]|uniref:PX domain-containing protein n=1 Tax=Smittium megazygosporum TaxID=133381 RepID=A0A2T9Z7S8_9FUNG|nr:hypothetical protein BB560_004959 [Smittium megazygosporum]
MSNRKSFVAYSIQTKDQVVLRRYSEFDSLHELLSKLYPTEIIPPLPEKHTILQTISVKDKGSLEKKTIENRIRNLKTFLNRISVDPVLKHEHIFHRFLTNGVSWDEVLHSNIISKIPSNPLFFSPSFSYNETSNSESLPHQERLPIAALNSDVKLAPVPIFLNKINHPSIEWENRVINSNRSSKIWKEKIEFSAKKILYRLKKLNESYSELGATLNALSLIIEPDISPSVESTGQAIDLMCISSKASLNSLSAYFMDTITEYSKFFYSRSKVLSFRDYKQMQLELTEFNIENKKQLLKSLYETYNGITRLSEALSSNNSLENTESSNTTHIPAPKEDNTQDADQNHLETQSNDEINDDNFLTFTQTGEYNFNFLDNNGKDKFAPSKVIESTSIEKDLSETDPIEDDSEDNYTDVSNLSSDDPLLDLSGNDYDLDNELGIPSAIPDVFKVKRHKIIPNPKRPKPGSNKLTVNSSAKLVTSLATTESSKEISNGASSSRQPSKNENQPNTLKAKDVVKERDEPKKSDFHNHVGNAVYSPEQQTTSVPSVGLFNQFSYAFYKMVDIDPNQKRKLEIKQLENTISQLEDTKLILAKDVELFNNHILSTLENFDNNQKQDFSLLLSRFAGIQIQFSKKVFGFKCIHIYL